jgi:predicted HicB family RNase H-like nuclease
MRKASVGRPPIPPAKRRSVRVTFRLTAALHKAVAQAAQRDGKTVGTYIADTLAEVLKGE